MIESEISKARNDLHQLSEQRRGLGLYRSSDDGEEADRNQQLTLIIARTNLANNKLKRLIAARQRLSEGEYGYCLSCGLDIAPERLKIDPAAESCSDCASLTGLRATAA